MRDYLNGNNATPAQFNLTNSSTNEPIALTNDTRLTGDNGDNTFVGDTASGVTVAAGNGNDELTALHLNNSRVSMGNGNDDVAAIDIAGDTMVVGLSTGGPASFNFQPPVAVGTRTSAPL